MDSQEQLETDSNKEQPNAGTGDEGGNQSQTFEVNWQTLTWDKLLENYTKLQAEYTQARQEVSETKKNSELSDEDKVAIDFIKKNWFVTKDDLDSMSKRQAQDVNLENIIASNPDLQPFKSAIKELWKKGDMAYEDIIQTYGFKSKDKLSKARAQWDIKWMPEPKEKPISEMSDTEYEKYKVKKWWGSKWTFG